MYDAYDNFEDFQEGEAKHQHGDELHARGHEHAEAAAAAAAPHSEWKQVWDDSAQAYYYENSATGETSWEAPEHFNQAAGYD